MTVSINHVGDVLVDEVKLIDDDIVNVEDYSPGNTLWIIHEEGFVVCAVIADNEQDALDIAVDEDKMDAYLIYPDDYEGYGVYTDDSHGTHLGNASEPFDIGYLGIISVKLPPVSIVALLKHQVQQDVVDTTEEARKQHLIP